MSANLLALLQMCDSLFPIGAFAHSDGLEAATSSGRVQSATQLGTWMDATLTEVLRRFEVPALCRASEAFSRDDFDRLEALDEEAHALRPSSGGRRASRSMGTRLAMTWQQIRPEPRLAPLLVRRTSWTLPIAFGVVSAVARIEAGDAMEGYCYTRLAATISAAMRLMPLGQREGHTLLARHLERVPALVREVSTDLAPLRSFSPALDLAAMAQQYGHSRLFRS